LKYVQLRDHFKDHTIFSLTDIRLLEPDFHRRRLNEWQDKGYIKKVIKEFYIFADKPIEERSLFEIANKIYKPSYISFETSLSYYQLIPESVYRITSASSRRTYTFHTEIGIFSYRTVKPQLFFGYEIISTGEKNFKMAEPEKAILDFLYLNPQWRTPADFESLRLSTEGFSQTVNLEKLGAYARRFSNKALLDRSKNLKRIISSGEDQNSA
jgi:predicted transcriptional regulator of viral defense system